MLQSFTGVMQNKYAMMDGLLKNLDAEYMQPLRRTINHKCILGLFSLFFSFQQVTVNICSV